MVSIGGDVVVVDSPSAADEIRSAVGDGKIRLGLDGVCGSATALLGSVVSEDATIVVYALLGATQLIFNPLDLMYKRVSIRVFSLTLQEPTTKVLPALQTFATMMAEGKITYPFSQTYPLSQFKDAIASAQRGQNVLLDMGGVA